MKQGWLRLTVTVLGSALLLLPAGPPLLAAPEVAWDPGALSVPTSRSGRVAGFSDRAGGRYSLSNERLTVSLGYGADGTGVFSVIERASGAALLTGATSGIRLADGTQVRLTDAAGETQPRFQPIEEPGLGRGLGLTADFRVGHPSGVVQIRLGLFDEGTYVLHQLRVVEGARPEAFDVLDGWNSRVVTGEQAAFITDYGRLKHVRLEPGMQVQAHLLGEGRPLFLWSERRGTGFVAAPLDETETPVRSVLVPAGHGVARIGIATPPMTGAPDRSPRLFLDFPQTANPRLALARFRDVSHALHPPLPLPAWFRYQWNSWYTYYTDVSESDLLRQGEYIASRLGDLGPWNIAVDAGWYVAEGRAGGDWRAVDRSKFPNGMRAFAFRLWERGVRTVLYFSAPYVDDRPVRGNWLGLAGLVRGHPDWLIKVDANARGSGYVYDLGKPELRSYLTSVLEDFFKVYEVDGIAVDGLGLMPSTPGTRDLKTTFGVRPDLGRQTMDLYRLIHRTALSLRPDAYIMAGWDFPQYANPYAHAFWYGDETPGFSGDYPFGGLLEHIDYTVVQQGMWGQRSHLGYIYGDPNTQPVTRWWLEAAIALGAQVALGFDLTTMSRDTLDRFRERLVHYRPLTGDQFVLGTFPVSVFGTHRDGMTYLGLLNRGPRPAEMRVALEEIGLNATEDHLVLDVELGSYSRARETVRVTVPPGSFRLLLLKPSAGVVWTNSSYEETVTGEGMTVRVNGPAALPGYIELHGPAPEGVWLDGRPASARYYPEARILRVDYPHDRPHEIRVAFASGR